MSLVFNQKITLDLTISRVQNVHCSQDDADSRNILITLSDNGKPYSIPSEVRIFLKISKPDNTYVYIDEDDADHLFRNDDGTISIILSEQATCVPGICEAELQFITPKETISTRKFNIIVKKSVINDEEIESVIESNIIQKMIRHLIDFMNPHKVNKEQVGLGNVPNVTTNDQTPTYEEAEEFENISSGEKLSIAFGKIQKAISSLLGHINNFDNPHKTTKSQIQLGNVDNTSDVDKPVSTAQQKAIDGAYANSNKYTDQKIADLINGAPETMDTLKEIADAIEKNKSVVEALDKSIGTKANQNELDTHTGNDTIHITSDERTKWNDANNKKHSHNNKSVLDGITSELVQKWTETSSSSVTGIKGVNEDSFRRGNVELTAENVGAVATGGDTAENTATFTSGDVADGSASAWTNVSKLSSGEKHSSIFKKVSQMFKNVRYLYKMLGTTDISKIGNGTCTGAISSLNDGLANKYFLKVVAKDWSGFVGTLFPQFNVQNDNVVDIYADKTDGTYPAVRVARASADYDGNNIPDTYLKKADAKNNVSGLSNTMTNYNDQTPVVQYFTVPDDGYYLVTGLVTFSSNANGFREVFITNTTSNYVMGRIRVPAVSGSAVTLQVTSGGTFEPGQTGTLSTYQNSGSNLNVQEWLSMVKIAPKL